MEGFAEVWKRSRGVFLTAMAFAAFLPVLLAGVLSPNQLRVLTSASSTTPVRLWIEPTSVVVAAGQPFTFTVMAEYDDKHLNVAKLTATAVGDEGVEITQPIVVYTESFSGTVRLGTVKGVAKTSGRFTVRIPQESVQSLPEVPIITNQAEVIVQ